MLSGRLANCVARSKETLAVFIEIIESRFTLQPSPPPLKGSPREQAADRLRSRFQSLSETENASAHRTTPSANSLGPIKSRSRLHRLLSLCPCPIDHLATSTDATQTHPFRSNPSSDEKVPASLLWIFIILGLSSAAAIVELLGGHHSESASLLADGWHMVAHVLAIAMVAYVLIKKRRTSSDQDQNDSHIVQKAGKLEVRISLANAFLLMGAGAFTAIDAIMKLNSPINLHSHLAISSACAGLTINALCALVIRRKFNISEPGVRSAFFHILADIITSVLAIAAILISTVTHFFWVDPILGLLGGVWIGLMGVSLLKNLRNSTRQIENSMS
jgi:cation diffusion facilitator family transporter